MNIHKWKYGDHVKVHTPYTFWNGASGHVVELRYTESNYPIVIVRFEYGQMAPFQQGELELLDPADAPDATKEKT